MVKAKVGASDASMREVEFVVDMGAFYTILPPDVFMDLGIEVRLGSAS